METIYNIFNMASGLSSHACFCHTVIVFVQENAPVLAKDLLLPHKYRNHDTTGCSTGGVNLLPSTVVTRVILHIYTRTWIYMRELI